MTGQRTSVVGVLASLLLLTPPARADDGAPRPIHFDRDIRPILADRCFKCHGPDADERQAEFRLDLRDEALQGGDSGEPAIVPGKPEASPLVKRIFSKRKGLMMPPPDSNKVLSAAEKALLRDWVAQGAAYQAHWSFTPPRRTPLPEVKRADWPRQPLDRFVLARIEAGGLSPAAEADRATLIRRLTLDLTGLPPTLREVDAFLADRAPDAYETVVERLLASPHYGERMALDWLDAARFADTNGYHIDNGRDMTRWRAWVIDAYNRDLPFDEFTVDQLAGDLRPGATPDQKVASGFNRNHMINFEGGAVPAEYQNAYVVDRVNTTGTVWLGLTIACAQCHDHKFDPIAQKEYYQLYAFFHNVPENGLDGRTGNSPPLLRLPAPEQSASLDRLAAEMTRAEARRGLPALAFDPIAAIAQAALLRAEIAALKKAQAELEKAVPTTMVMQELPSPRETFLLIRGQYDKKGEPVRAGVPASLPPLPADAPRNRLGLARWLVDPAHPLTARVAVNRLWQGFFGTGIVKTAEDFGAQGEPPSHPELLDWLAVEFIEPTDGQSPRWSVKALVRAIVTSATYRQSSLATPDQIARDPENRLLARGPRLRLPAEFLRDQALALSGLLDARIGGRSVSPYQPAGLWEELASRLDGKNWTAQSYTQDHGSDLYRRTMYTFWKRTSPPPTLLTFDAPDRETCTVRRARTNTPLQALILMNDPTYVEAARKLAERIMTEGGISTDDRIAFAFRLATARLPRAGERAVLRAFFEDERTTYRNDPTAALKLLAVGELARNQDLDPAELAAWSMVASAILNLDEVVTKN